MIIDKVGFDRKSFIRAVQKLLNRIPEPYKPRIDDQLMYKVVQTLLRNRANANHVVVRNKWLRELSQVLERPASIFIRELRGTTEEVVIELIEEAETEEIKLAGRDRRAFPEPGDFTHQIILSLRGLSEDQDKCPWWPLEAKWMKQVLVLEALYGKGFDLKPALMQKLAVQEGALNRLRVQGIREVATRLSKRWP